MSEDEEDDDPVKKEERRQRRLTKEVKWLRSKLIRIKEKLKAAKKERETLRDVMKKNQVTLKFVFFNQFSIMNVLHLILIFQRREEEIQEIAKGS